VTQKSNGPNSGARQGMSPTPILTPVKAFRLSDLIDGAEPNTTAGRSRVMFELVFIRSLKVRIIKNPTPPYCLAKLSSDLKRICSQGQNITNLNIIFSF
jgi:hypothetical protein